VTAVSSPAASTDSRRPTKTIRRRIAVVVPELLPVPPVKGGAVELWVHEVTGRMQAFIANRTPAERSSLSIVSRPAGSAGVPGIDYIGIPWTAMERRMQKIKDAVTWRNPLRYVAKIQNVWSYGRRAARAVQDFDLIYIHNEPNLLLFFAKSPQRKLVLHMHNDHLSSRLFRPIYDRALARADVVLCVSDYIRERAVQMYPAHAARFRVVENSTDPQVFRPYGAEAWTAVQTVMPRAPAINLLYVGRLVAIKGVHVLIEAFKLVHARDPRARLVIAGSSFFEGASTTPYQNELVALAEPVKDALIFTGYLPHATLKFLYSAADMVVVPSVWQEPSGLVVLEAMASGTCVVAAAVGGIPELIEDGTTGVLVPANDPRALAAAVLETLSNPEKKSRMEAAARTRVASKYTWERVVGEIDSVFGDLS